MEFLQKRIDDLAKKRRNEHLAFLKSLIAQDTAEKEMNGQNIILSRLKNLQCEIDIFEPDPKRLTKYEEFNEGHEYHNRANIVATFKGRGGGKSLLLNGHIDTVYPSKIQSWTVNPWDPTIRDGRLYGLGSCDMKAGLAALLMALELINELEIPLRGDIIFESVVDEEAGGGNGTLACIDRGYTADAALVAEPTCLEPKSTHVGSVAFRITFEGVASHSNLKWEGVNAFEMALPLINRLQSLESKWKREQVNNLLDSPILSINRVDAGYGAILVPANCKIEGNFTYLPGWEDSLKEFYKEIEESTKESLWLKEHPPIVELIHHVRPYSTDPNDPWPQFVKQSMERVVEKEIKISGFPTGADARLLANTGGMPTIILGPGNIRQAHTVDEFVEIEEYYDAIVHYILIIIGWCQ